MNITKENVSDLTAEIKLHIEKEDYKEKVDEILKDHRKKASMPGFRPGKVPYGLIKKKYGDMVFFEEVNKLVQESLINYIKDNDFKIIGSPLPNNEKSSFPADMDEKESFDLVYDVALEPEFEVDLSNNEFKVDYNKIKVNDEEVEKLLQEMRKRYGDYTNPEEVEGGDLLYGEFTELDENGNNKEDGIINKSSISLDYIKNDDIKNKLIGIKKEETVVFNPMEATGNESEVAAMLDIDKDVAKELKSNFSFTLLSISRVVEAELNQEFFDKVYKNENIESEEDLKVKIREDAEKTYSNEADKVFVNKVMEKLKNELNIEIPAEFLKRWLVETDKEQKLTHEEVDKNFDMYAETIKFQLIQNKIEKEYDIKVEESDVDEYLEAFIRKQFAHLLQDKEKEEETIKGIISSVKQNKEEMDKVHNNLLNKKITELFKDKVNMEEKEVSYEEFVKIANETAQG